MLNLLFKLKDYCILSYSLKVVSKNEKKEFINFFKKSLKSLLKYAFILGNVSLRKYFN